MARGIGWVLATLTALLALAPLAALGVATLVDLGPGGSLRGSVLYIALEVFDPYVWACLWNSLTVAIVVTFGSWLLGVALARMIDRWRFWGRGALWMLSCVPLSVLPLLGAIGLRHWLSQAGAWGVAWAWLAWVWVGLAYGVPIVALATRSALRRVDPVWEDAARVHGASPRQIWWTIVWPVARPEAARAVAAVFTLTLLEPGAPLVLGLRRTLAYQVVEAALGSTDLLPRAAGLALWGVALAALGRLLVRWWSRVSWPAPPLAHDRRGRRAGWLRGLGLTVLIGGWNALALAPIVSLVSISLAPPAGSSSAALRFPAFAARLRADSEVERLACVSLALGAGAATIGLVLASSLAMRATGYGSRWASAVRRLAALPEAVPPLALGVGAMLIPVLLAGTAATGSGSTAGSALRRLSEWLDPYTAPGVLLVAALAVLAIPRLSAALELVRDDARAQLAEAARTLGASPRQARRSLFRLRLGGAPASAWLVSATLAACSLAPALLLAPTAEARPIAPVVLALADQPGTGLLRSADLATVAVALNLAAFVLAARRRAGPVGAWFRG